MNSINVLKLAVSATVLMFAFVISVAAQSAPNITVNGYFTPDKVQRGRNAQGVVEVAIPHGFHIHSNKPLEKILIATKLDVEAPAGVRVGPVSYPRALMRNLKFSKNKVAVFEGKTTMRFRVTVPANYSSDTVDLKARLRYQSCNDEVCFPPKTQEMKLTIKVG